ncbi:MAG: hypothetical protein ACFIN3_00490 [Candidatus Walczuchella monophlebidarum]
METPILNMIEQRDTHLHNSLEAAQKVREEIRIIVLKKVGLKISSYNE